MSFGTKGVEVNSYLPVGIHVVKITSVKPILTNDGVDSAIEVNFANQENAVGNQRFFITKATGAFNEVTLKQMKHLFLAVLEESTLDTVEADNLTDYCSKLSKLVEGKQLLIKLNSVFNQDKSKVYPKLKNMPFAEKVNTTPTTLIYNEKDNDVVGNNAKPSTQAEMNQQTEDLPWQKK